MKDTEKMRQEIKRLRKEIKDEKDPLALNQKAGYLFALTDMESFLDTLSEDPVQKFNTDKLQEIAKPATPHKKPTPEDRAKFMEELHEYAESKKLDKSLNEAAKDAVCMAFGGDPAYYGNKAEFSVTELERLFIAGWKCRDAQMLKDAVEGLICATITGTDAISFLSPLPKELTAGDKVKIIIVKEEE